MKTVIAPQAPQGPRHPALLPRATEPPVSQRGIAMMTLAAALACGPLVLWAAPAEARNTTTQRQASERAAAAARPAAARPATTSATGSRRARNAANHATRTSSRVAPRSGRHHATPARHSRHASAGPRMPDRPQDFTPVAIGGGAMATTTLFQGSPRAACLEATRRAEQVHGLPTGLLTAIALSESGLHAYAMNIGGRAVFPETPEAAAALLQAASARRSVMAGCLQINARVHARGESWPLDARRSADWAGGMMARWGQEHGWAEALRRWHGGSHAATPRLVCRVRAKLEVTQPGSDLFREFNCNTGREDRTRRNGAAHYGYAAAEAL